MADVGLNIRISAQVQDAVAGIGKVSDNLSELSKTGKGNLLSVTSALNELRQAAAAAGNPTELEGLNRAIQDLGGEATKLRNTGIEPVRQGLGALNLNMSQSRVAFLDFARVISGQGLTLRGLAANMTLIGPAALIAVAAIGYLGEELYKMAIKATDAELAQKEFNKVMLEGSASVQGEISRIKDLTEIVGDENNARATRLNAFKELQKEYPTALKNLDFEKSSIQDITKATNDLTGALIRQAEIKGFENAISEQSKKIADEQIKTVEEATSFWDKLKATIVSTPIQQYGSTLPADDKPAYDSVLGDIATENKLKNINTAQTAIDKLQEGLKALLTTASAFGDFDLEKKTKLPKIDELQKEIDALNQAKEALTSLVGGSGKKPTFAIQEQLDAVNTQLLEDKIKKALRDGVKNGLSPQIVSEQVAALEGELAKIGSIHKVSIAGRVDIKESDIEKTESEITKQFDDRGIHVKLPADIILAIQEGDKSNAEKQALIKKIEDDTKNNVPTIRFNVKIQSIVDYATYFEQIKKDISKKLQDLATSGIEAVATGIGRAISGQKNPFAGFIEVLGDGLETIGKYLISTVPLITALQEALKNLGTVSPLVLLAAGVGLVAVGAAIKTSIKATPFAEGGVVTGPTYGLVGEAGPEAIFPLSKINDFVKNVGGGSSNVNVAGQFKIAGSDLRLVLQRADKNQNLVG